MPPREHFYNILNLTLKVRRSMGFTKHVPDALRTRSQQFCSCRFQPLVRTSWPHPTGPMCLFLLEWRSDYVMCGASEVVMSQAFEKPPNAHDF